MTAPDFTTAFVFFAACALSCRLWLLVRQLAHVRAHRATVPPAFTERISAEAHRKAADYTVARARLLIVEALAGTLWLLALTLGGGIAMLEALLAGPFDQGSLGHGTALLAALFVLGWLVDLPFSLYRTFVLEARFGFNRISPALFAGDTLKAAVLATLIGLPTLAGALWLMQATGERWWQAVWLFWLAFNLLALLLWPTVIAPRFNTFTPLDDAQLVQRIERLLARCGFGRAGLFVMDGSRRSAHGNAYFTGFGRSRRIVFFDTLLARLTPVEIEAVLAHELGHHRCRHLWKRLVAMAVGGLGLLALIGQLASQPWFHAGLGVATVSPATTLALLLYALPVFLFPLSPLVSLWSRHHEFEADAFACQNGLGPALVRALVKLYRDNASTLTPDPLYSAWHDTHPPAALRIARIEAHAPCGQKTPDHAPSPP